MDKVNDEYFATIDDAVKEPMNRVIEDAFHSLDSVGGTIETAIINMPAGVGETPLRVFSPTLSIL